MTTIVQEQVGCEGCFCCENITTKKSGSYGDDSDFGARSLGYERVSIQAGDVTYRPLLCPRCLNRMSEEDHLCLAILIFTRQPWKPITVKKIVDNFCHHKQKTVEDQTWRLIEKGLLRVDDEGCVWWVSKFLTRGIYGY